MTTSLNLINAPTEFYMQQDNIIRRQKGIFFVAIYVEVNDTIEYSKKNGLVVKVEVDLRDYSSSWPGQPPFFANLEKKFDEKIPSEKQKQYHSGNGMLLYLIMHLNPDIANVVRELSKDLQQANMAAYKEMY
ncbi:hypothetical protein ACHAXS_000361 [Conticribra weissflogii]